MENHCPRSHDPPTLLDTLGHTDKLAVLGSAAAAVGGQMTGEGHQEQLKAERTPKRDECPRNSAGLSGPACPEDEMLLSVAFGIGVLLALAGSTAAHGCVAPHHLVSKLLHQLEDSVKRDEPPNPSILLAMNLAGATDSSARQWLLQQIQKEAVKKAQKDMTSGQVALYVLALLSSCQNPQQVHALGHTVDLLSILQQKTDEEMASLETEGVPITTLYSVSLDALALCLAGAGGYREPSVMLAKQVLSPESDISVDTRAVAALALTCTYSHVDLQDEQDLLWEALSTVTNEFLDEQEKGNGMIGNIYSMGLALQALGATSKFYAPREWDCTQAFSVVYKHDYRLPMAIAQVLPALVGKSYLEAAHVDCDAIAASITVHYSVINKLRGKHFSYTISVQVPRGSTLLRVLQEAAAKEPNKFSFKTEQTSWGPMVVSIHGLAASSADRTYWQFLSGQDALQEGVGTYKPHMGEHIQAVFSTY
ncbi:cobalamin binding intrinsic factor [Falco biarmicus]|uniref:cobalamin binding intrinsic factor n=1 Tax=Falco rusticolus TaxID=120794 RepID=UPI0018867314|nr:cobalamin binding intrinsic factor [Falco rusticolus]XP_055577708.1 cobalamin binding intrinsic factor [Falco cherrug]XP_056209328.1 cobalamin binding intrinsic factor [Falco biarmicus]